jgi:hypothetical protein
MGEPSSFRRQSIEMGSIHIGIPVTSQLGSQVIGNDPEDMGAIVGKGQQRDQKESREKASK